MRVIKPYLVELTNRILEKHLNTSVSDYIFSWTQLKVQFKTEIYKLCRFTQHFPDLTILWHTGQLKILSQILGIQDTDFQQSFTIKKKIKKEESNPTNFIVKDLWFMNAYSMPQCLGKRLLPCTHKMEPSEPHPTAALKENCSPASWWLHRGPGSLQHHCKEPHGKALWGGNKHGPEEEIGRHEFDARCTELQNRSTAKNNPLKALGLQKFQIFKQLWQILFVEKSILKQLHFL